MTDNTEESFIGMLLNETCEAETSKDHIANNVVDLRTYFEKKVNEVEFIDLKAYLTSKEIKFAQMNLIPEIGTYRAVINEEIFDFPKNWSIFAELERVSYYSNMTNEDHLNEIFSSLVGYTYQLAFVNEEKHIEMIFVPEADAVRCREWLMNYANKKEEIQSAA